MDAKILVILSLVASAIAGPITTQDNDKCSTECKESSKFKYNPRTTYVYDYRVDTDTSLHGAFENSAKTTLQTSVNIEVLSQCEFVLQLRNTRLFHTDAKGVLKTANRESEFRSEVEGSPLRFSFQNGVVDHVCAEKEDTVRSLNIKKGILSAFQNSMDDLTKNQNVTETDVAGVCKAEYKLVSNGYYTTEVKKVKDILSCSDRLDFTSMFQSTPYKVPSDLQNLPLMKTTHECEQAVENGGVLKSSTCKESHIYRPFANGESGAKVTVTQTLTYQTYSNGVSARADNVKSRSSLLFDHSADHPTSQQARIVVEKKLGELCENSLSDIRPETPRLFNELVAAMKGLDKTDLTELHRLLKTKNMCPTNGRTYKHFHDALPMVGTSASVSLMTDLILSEDASGMEASAWLTSLAFIRNPTSDMLLDVKALIENKKVREDAMLPVTSMANNYCKKTGTCGQDFTFLSLIASLERNIDYQCDASGKKFQITLLTLKAIGNAGNAIRAVPVLNKCLTSSSNPLEIRIAAAEAFRRMPCNVEEKNLWETLNDKDLDSELRINAYLALMRCPTESTLGKMATLLNGEEDEQVGAFVYSHLTNLRETSDPLKQDVAEAINNLALDKEFDLSPLKYSRNFEVSALINKLNTGVTAESNLIWSNKAQLPRAVSGNLTIELFGQSINLLDFGGRLEGLEYLIKTVFGNYVNSDKKDSNSKMDSANVKGSVYGRLFGNEMLFMHSQTFNSRETPSWLDLVIKMAKEQHVALTQNVQFMDVCMVIPSSAGLPIHVTVNGTATVDLNMSGKMDLRKAGSSPRSMDVDGEIRPSAALEITGTMYVDSFVTKTGLRMRNTLHTSTAMKGRIQMNRGQQLNVELDTPEDKIEIFDARSKFFVLHDDMEQEQEMIKKNRKDFKYCSSKQMTTITGMEICGEVSFPNASMEADSPYFPLTGPTSASLTLFKKDSHSGYKLFAKRVENKKASIAQISFNTPGSQVDRAMSVDMSLNYKKQNVELNMATPWKKLSMNGNMINLKELKSISGNVVVDDKHTYAMTGEVKVSQTKTKIQLNPMIEIRRPEADNVQVTGFVSIEKPLKSFNMDMSLSGLSKFPYTIKSALTNNKKEKSVEASFSTDGKKEYTFKASNQMNFMGKKSIIAVITHLLEVHSPERKLVSLSSNVDYREGKSLVHQSSIFIHRVLKKPATFKVNLSKTSRKKAINYKGVLNLKSSLLTGAVVCSVARKPNGLTSAISKVDYSIPKVANNGITFSGKLNDRSTKAYKLYFVQSTVNVKKNPELNSDMKVEIRHKKKLSYASMDLKYGDNFKDKSKRVYFLSSLNRKITNLKNAVVSYKVKAQAPAHEIDVLLQGKHQHSPKLLDSNVKLTYAPEKEISADILLKDRSTKLAKISGNAALSWPGKEYTMNTDFTQKSEKQYSHVLNLKSSSGVKHTISTVYKMPRSNSHDVVTSIKLDKMKPFIVSGATSLNLRNFAASADVKTGKDVYGFSTLYKISKSPSGKFSLELIHPARRMSLDVNGGKNRGKYEGKVEAAWDADKNKDSKITLEGGFFHKSAKSAVSLGGNVNFESPFENFEKLFGSVKYGSDPAQHTANGKLLWGDRSKQITSSMTVKKPFNLRNLQFNGDLKTPFKGIRNAEIDVVHKMDSDLSTVVNGKLEKENAKLSIKGQTLENGFKGNMNLKSTIKNAQSVTMSVSHTGNDDNSNSNAEINHNGNVYAYDLTMSHSGNGWQRKTSGDLMLTMNKQKIATHWDHKNTDEMLQSSVRSKWNDKRILIDLTGSHKLSDLRSINGVLKIKSPWKPVRDIELNMDHKHGFGLLNNVAVFKQGSNKKASSFINYNRGQNTADLDFEIMSPFHRDISGKLNTNYDSYPMTSSADLKWGNKKASSSVKLNRGQNSADFDFDLKCPFLDDISGKVSTNYNNYPMTSSAELKWAPKMKGTLEGSLNLASWDNADVNVKMTTPSRQLRNVVLKASNKKEEGDIVSRFNLDYGMRQNLDVESRISNGQKKMFRLKVNSPCEYIKSMNTGFSFNGHAYNFNTQADFELLPSIGKFDGAMNWRYDDDMVGKIRVDTPFPDYPYFELSTSSNADGDSQKCHLQAEYHPRQVFSIDSTSSFDKLPISLDVNIRSPYPEFNNIGMSLQHDMTDASVKSHGEVQYQAGKKVEGDFNADWSSNVEGTLVVKTPFSGYESNKITMRHRGELDNFDSHGEISVAEKNIVADASFKSGYTTTGTFTFTSPIPGLENIDATLNKKGNKKNVRGGVTINFNGEKVRATFNNKLTKDSLKTSVTLVTPFLETVKLTFDHSGLVESFTNKININYGRKVDIDTIASFDLRGNDVNGNGILKYKLGSGRNTARVSFSKSGSLEDVSFSATTGFNRDEITLTGSLRSTDGIDGSIQITTPFDSFKSTGMKMSHSGSLSAFTSTANVNYMDNKNVDGKLEFSSRNGVKLSGELTTPFKGYESTNVKFDHDISYSGDVTGVAELTTTICEFGTGELSYSKTGDLNDVVVKGSVSSNGKDMVVLKMTNKMQDTEVHSMCSFKSAVTPEVYLTFDHVADDFSFDTKTVGKVGRNMMSADAKMKRKYELFSVENSITYKLEGENKNELSASMLMEGPLDNCNFELTGKFNSEEAKLSATRSGLLNDMRFSGSASYNRDSVDVSGGWKNTESMEGNLKVLTPFEGLKNFGMVFSHRGDMSDFNTHYDVNLEDKSINGKVELTAFTFGNIKFISELTTPFEGMKSVQVKFNNNYNSFTSAFDGNAALDTTIADFGTVNIVYSKNGGLNDLDISGNLLRNGVEIGDLKIKNNIQDKELHSSFEHKSTMTPHIKLTLDHNGDLSNMKSSARLMMGKKNVIKGEASLSLRENTVNAEGKVMYTIKDFGNDQFSLNIHKEGELNNFNVAVTGKHNGKDYKITGNFKNEDELSGDLTINSPIEGYNNVGLSFKHSGGHDRFNCEGKINLVDGEEFSGKVDFYRYLTQRIEVVAELKTPIPDFEFSKYEYRHEGQSDSFTCTSTLQYGKSQKLVYDMKATSTPKPEITVTLKLNDKQVLATGSYENTYPKYGIYGKLEQGKGMIITLDGSIDLSNDVVGTLTVTTPVEDFTNVGASFQFSSTSNSVNAEGRVNYMDDKVISGKADAKMTKTIYDASVELSTPFPGYELSKFDTKTTINRKMIKSVQTVIYGDNKRIALDAYTKFKPSPEISLTISCPYSQDIVAFASLDNSSPKYGLTAKLSPGNGEDFTLDGAFDTSSDISGSLKIGTPFPDFNKVGMSFMHSGNEEKFGTEGTITYKDGKEIFGKVNFYRYMWRRIDASAELTTPFSGMKNTKAEINFEKNSESISATAALDYSNGEKINGNVKVTYSPNYEVLVTMNTPFNEQGVIRLQGALDVTAPTFEAMGSLNYDYNQVYSIDGKLNVFSPEQMDGSLEVNSPLPGFEYTKAEYQHKADSNGLDALVSLTYDNGKKMSCDIKSTLSPNFDGTITVKTPYRGFENMQGSATFDSSYKKYETTSSLSFGQGIAFSMSSELDYSIEPMKVATKINTPYRNFRNVELVLTHEGGLTNFKTTGFLSSPLTDHINAKASLRYDAAMDMSAAASLQTSLEGFDDLRAEVKTSDLAGEMKTSAMIGWTSGQQISYDGIFSKKDGWNEDKMHADVSFSTPFVAVRSVNMQIDHSAQTNSYGEKLNFELNGVSLLDMEAEYNGNDKQSAELIVRQPWPMQYTASKSSYDGITDVEVYADWNRDEPNNNVRAQATVTDKSDNYQTENGIDLSVTYASRKMGMVHKLSGKSSEVISGGYFYWNADDDSKVSYDLQMNDNSRRRKQILDGSFKLGLPTRTLALTGSYSENAASISTDASFNWDADRDTTKQIGVKANIKNGDNLKGDVTLSMPSFRKEIQVNGEVMLNNGRVILDTKTDITYSRDSSKTLTLTSKLEDVSDSNSNFNYSLALGLKHSHTNVDIQMNSHIGSSEKMMTVGIDTSYLTSKRQTKNLALLSEINMLKKQISVQFFNPMNKIEVIGDIVSDSPQKLRLMNKVDDVEMFRSEMTIDDQKKAFTINTFTDSNILSFTAKYPNNSAFRVDFTRHTPLYDQEEALLAVRLNTSRLLHTRLSWHPDMMQELQDYVRPIALKKAESALLELTSFNDAVAEELSSKYSAISREITEELRPFIDALNEELAIVADKMAELSVELKEMYERNDYHVQRLGQGVLKLQEKFEKLSKEYRTIYSELILSLRESLNEMRYYPVGPYYTEFVSKSGHWIVQNSLKAFLSLEMYMSEVDLAMKEYRASLIQMKQTALDTVYNATYVDYLADRMSQIQNIDISPYVSSFNLPEQYTNIVSDVPARFNDKLNKILGRSEMKFVKEGLNEVYQQSIWAYNYWQVEENLEKHAKSILKTLREIIEDELKEFSENFDLYLHNPITVWDPKHGEIQADIPLPIDVKRLDKLPDFSQLTKKAEKFADTYLPDEKTWDKMVKTVSDMMPESKKASSKKQLTKIKPAKKNRKKGRKYKVKKSRQ